ncbi:hypothetical protein CCACVL1_20999 [Corchorus capsularis]|uniref:Uncharacterized protein n=1 Tax=Corchorus capsularis TaxID=210143 RepID=A0A1R3H8R9_COCAP|nr:hypothetical protein CCACVL1_20999 [Corchorus capsularis]
MELASLIMYLQPLWLFIGETTIMALERPNV